LARAAGAELVDQESLAFVEAARLASWRWAIVRGVSDDADSRLPRHIARWVRADGRTNGPAIVCDLCRRPTDLWRLVVLGRAARRAMNAVSEAVRGLTARSTEPR
jgi:hypothetical protein